MKGKLEVYPTETLCLIMYEARFPINELLRKTLRDRHSEELLQFSFSFQVPQRVWDDVDRYLNDGGKMPKWDMCQNKLVFQSAGHEAKITFQKLLLKDQLTLQDGLYVAEFSVPSYLSGEIIVDPAYFVAVNGEGVPEPESPILPPKRGSEGGDNHRGQYSSRRRNCEHCILLNPGNICALNKTKVKTDHSCSRFVPLKIYRGGSVSPR